MCHSHMVLGHVESRHRALVVEHELGQRAGQLGLADAGRAEEDERADRPVPGLAGPSARPGAFATASTAAPWPTTRWCRRSSMWTSFSTSPSSSRSTGTPVRGDDGGNVVLVDLLLHHGLLDGRAVALRELRRFSSSGRSLANLGDALQLAVPLNPFGLHAELVDLPRDLLDALERLASLAQRARARRGAPCQPRRVRAPPARARRRTPWSSQRLDLQAGALTRSASSSSSGEESISIRRRNAASSTRSIALSGRKRSVMYRSLSTPPHWLASRMRTPWCAS